MNDSEDGYDQDEDRNQWLVVDEETATELQIIARNSQRPIGLRDVTLRVDEEDCGMLPWEEQVFDDMQVEMDFSFYDIKCDIYGKRLLHTLWFSGRFLSILPKV